MDDERPIQENMTSANEEPLERDVSKILGFQKIQRPIIPWWGVATVVNERTLTFAGFS